MIVKIRNEFLELSNYQILEGAFHGALGGARHPSQSLLAEES